MYLPNPAHIYSVQKRAPHPLILPQYFSLERAHHAALLKIICILHQLDTQRLPAMDTPHLLRLPHVLHYLPLKSSNTNVNNIYHLGHRANPSSKSSNPMVIALFT